jgi:uncharacterized protein YdhG (YjbR/CyaY superfamily)
MVQSKSHSVDDWMTEVDPNRAAALAQLRSLCQEKLPGWAERMQWGMPGYGPAGADAVVSFNSQKQYIALYAGAAAVSRFADRLAGVDCGKGCIRFRKVDAMDFGLVGEILDDVWGRKGKG